MLLKNISFYLVITEANRHFLCHESTGVWHNIISRSNTVSSLVSFSCSFFFFTSTDLLGKILVTENHYQLTSVHKHIVKLYFKSGNIVTRFILLQLCFHSKEWNRPEQFWVTFSLFPDVLEVNPPQNINKLSFWPIMKNDLLLSSSSFSVILFLHNIFIFLSYPWEII